MTDKKMTKEEAQEAAEAFAKMLCCDHRIEDHEGLGFVGVYVRGEDG